MMAHVPTCSCAICVDVRARSVSIEQTDRLLLAAEWEKWISGTDGEAAKLRAGQDGSIGSPRWVALQAIARTRLGNQHP